jgi:hypothetical protein
VVAIGLGLQMASAGVRFTGFSHPLMSTKFSSHVKSTTSPTIRCST